MKTFTPEVPFTWPSSQQFDGPSIDGQSLPFAQLIDTARWLFGIVPALTACGVHALEEWLGNNLDLRMKIVVVVYPACATSQADLDHLRTVVLSHPDRFSARILALEQVTDRTLNVLCLSAQESDCVTITMGSSENLGLPPWGNGQLNFAFRADPTLLEAFRRHFDEVWADACDIRKVGATDIPQLVLPKGSPAAADTWWSYLSETRRAEERILGSNANETAVEESADPLTSQDDVTLSQQLSDTQSPTEQLGIKPLDPLGEVIAGIYAKGCLVSVDKLSKIPPLDAPLDPSLFGDASELRSGSVTRKVNMRVSVIDAKTLKALEACRSSHRTLLTKFTFGLADNMRWMPNTARDLFEAEVARANEEGLNLIAGLFQGDIDKFLSDKRPKLVADLNGIYAQMGRLELLPPVVIDEVVENLRVRLTKALHANFMPTITYSVISFSSKESAFSSPWGQACSLLTDIATFPRKAHTDAFFFRYVKTPKQDFVSAMDVAGDAIHRESASFALGDRSKLELALITAIENAPIEPKARCKLIMEIIQGTPLPAIEEELARENEKGSSQKSDHIVK